VTAFCSVAAAYVLVLVAAFYADVGGVRRHRIEAASFIFVAAVVATVMTRRNMPPARPVQQRVSMLLVALTSLTGALALYAPVIGAGLFADDFVLLEAARQGRWTVWSELFRPSLFLVWRAVDSVSPDSGAALHLLNIALHAANTTMTVRLAWTLGLPSSTGLVAGAMFLVFPGSVEPVAWPAGIQDVLMTSLVLGFLLLLMSSRLNAPRRVAAVALLIAACLTKESGVTAIGLAALVCLVSRAPRPAWMTLAAATAVVVVLVAVRFSLLPLPPGHAGLPSRYHVKELIVRPFATLVLPFRSADMTAMPWLPIAVVGLLLIATCLAAAWWDRRSRGFHVALMSAAFVLVSIAAVNTIFYVDDNLLGSRYLYLGSVGWSLLLAAIVYEVKSWSVLAATLAAVMLAATWAAAATAHVLTWRSAAKERDVILDAAVAARPADCRDILVDGLPPLSQGVPLFLNGFPEAMRSRLPEARYQIAPADGHAAACRMVWTGTAFRTP
jgi:hypothetical protein